MRRLALGVLLVAACGDDSSVSPDAETGPPDAEPPGPNLVTLSASGAEYVRYRNGAGAWQTPTQDPAGDYLLYVHDDYQVVVACADSTGADSTLIAATFAESDSQSAFCFRGTAAAGGVVQVSGQMTQPGEIFMSDYASSATGPWDFVLDVPLGPNDLIAIGEGQIAIRRGLSFTVDTTIPTVDVAQEGASLAGIPFILGGLDASEAVASEFTWFTGDGLALIPGTATEVLTPPTSMLEADDLRILDIDTTTATTERSVFYLLSGNPTSFSFTLMPFLTGISYSDDGNILRVSWGTLPTYRYAELWVISGSSFQRVEATRGWVDTTGATSLAFDPVPPDYDPDWRVDLDAPYSRRFELENFSGPVLLSTAVIEDVNGAALRRGPSAQSAAEVVREHLVELRAARVGEERVAGHDPAAAHRRLLRMLLRDRVEDLAE